MLHPPRRRQEPALPSPLPQSPMGGAVSLPRVRALVTGDFPPAKTSLPSMNYGQRCQMHYRLCSYGGGGGGGGGGGVSLSLCCQVAGGGSRRATFGCLITST